ncbi:MAG: hypothetical protein MOIL_01766 [Candidatus Methanolliviera sp. GoM_oil]|nr:MAG: hypothetical protein MOIL_01766 [Candidatus Methanolliviera sp. GoM_oil]
MGLADERDRSILKSSAKQDISRLENEIQTLEVGEALLTSPDAPFAIPLKVHLYEDYIEEDMEVEGEAEGKNKNIRIDEDFY